jgi:hypothetical protein
MKANVSPSCIDHHLVARVQSRSTGANAHDLHALLGKYFELCGAVEEDPECLCRARGIEQRLRAFCLTGRLRN